MGSPAAHALLHINNGPEGWMWQSDELFVTLNLFQGLLRKMLKRVQHDGLQGLRRQPLFGLVTEIDGGFQRVGGLEQRFLVEIVRQQLQTERQAVLVQTGGQ